MPTKRAKRKPRGSGREVGLRRETMPSTPLSGFSVCRLRAGQICPDRLIVPMKYSSVFSISGAGGVASYCFSQNSVFDPDVTSAGGSCAGFTTLMNLYTRYRVYSSKIRVTVQNANTNLVACAVAPTLTNLGTSVSGILVAGARHAKPHALRILPSNANGPAVVLEDSITTAELVGDQLFDDKDLYGPASSDPAAQFYWMVGSQDLNGLGYSFQGTVEIEYLTEFSEARDLPS